MSKHLSLHDGDRSNSSKKQKQENDSIPPSLPVVQLISSSCEEKEGEGPMLSHRHIKGTFSTGPMEAFFSLEIHDVNTDCGGAEAAISSELFGLYSMYSNGLRSEGAEDGWGEEGYYLPGTVGSCITKPGVYFSDANILAFLKKAGLENVQSPKCIEGGSIHVHERRKWVYGDIMSQAIQMLIDNETNGKPIQTQNQNFKPSDIYVWLGVQSN